MVGGMSCSAALIAATRQLSADLEKFSFGPPVAYVYNPLDYAWEMHEAYLRRYADSSKRVIFLGMNPGPFGMAQTGVPFGEIEAVRNFLGLFGLVGKPAQEHPKKPVDGFGCARSEVSGRRLWGLFAEKFGSAEEFFAEHYVHNYCPLLFLEDTKLGKNLTPEQLDRDTLARINARCDAFLRELVKILQPEFLVGVGGFAEKRAAEALEGMPVQVCRIIHPSPASPAANRGWAEAATRALVEAGIWRG